MANQVVDPKSYPITPEHIDASKHLWNAFVSQEQEVTAGWLVRFVQDRGEGWTSFTAADINRYYHEQGRPEQFWFNGLDIDGTLVQHDGHFHFTHRFVSACYKSSPAVATA